MKQGDSSSSKAKEANKSPTNANSTADNDQTKEELAAEFREDDKGEWFSNFALQGLSELNESRL